MEALRTPGEAKDGKFDFPQQEMLFDLSFFLSFFLSFKFFRFAFSAKVTLVKKPFSPIPTKERHSRKRSTVPRASRIAG